MPMLMLMCAAKSKIIPLGIEISREEKPKMPKELKFVRCPFCGRDHGWMPDDAFFEEEH